MPTIVSVQTFEAAGSSMSVSGLDLSGGTLAILVAGYSNQFGTPSMSIDWEKVGQVPIGTFQSQSCGLIVAAKENLTANDGFTLSGASFEVATLVLIDDAESLFFATGAAGAGSNPNPPLAGTNGTPLALAACVTFGVVPSAGPSGWSNFTVNASSQADAVVVSVATKQLTAGFIDPPAFTAGSSKNVAATILVK